MLHLIAFCLAPAVGNGESLVNYLREFPPRQNHGGINGLNAFSGQVKSEIIMENL